jgi:serine/threonine protein kinase
MNERRNRVRIPGGWFEAGQGRPSTAELFRTHERAAQLAPIVDALGALSRDLFVRPVVEHEVSLLRVRFPDEPLGDPQGSELLAALRDSSRQKASTVFQLGRFLLLATAEMKRHAVPAALSPLQLRLDRESVHGFRLLALPLLAPTVEEWAEASPEMWRWTHPSVMLGAEVDAAHDYIVGAALHTALAGELVPLGLDHHEHFARIVRGHLRPRSMLLDAMVDVVPLALRGEGAHFANLVNDLLETAATQGDARAALQRTLSTWTTEYLMRAWRAESEIEHAATVASEASRELPEAHPSRDHLGADPLIGQTLVDRYLVQQAIGRGGFGVVYRAWQEGLKRYVAIKVLHPNMAERPDLLRRFENEARGVSAIGNPHIVSVFDVGALPDGRPFYVMEYLQGSSLFEQVAQGPLPIARALRIVDQLGDALTATHRAGTVHRDLKPENIFLITQGDEPDFVKVLDFGIAQFETTGTKLTKEGDAPGSPPYMSPEQLRGQKVDARTDLYAIGVVLYEMLCGVPPFTGETFSVITQHLHEPPCPLSRRSPPCLVPASLEHIILTCLAKEPEARFESARALRNALASVRLDEPPDLEDHEPPKPEPPEDLKSKPEGGTRRGHAWLVGALCAVVACALGALTLRYATDGWPSSDMQRADVNLGPTPTRTRPAPAVRMADDQLPLERDAPRDAAGSSPDVPADAGNVAPLPTPPPAPVEPRPAASSTQRFVLLRVEPPVVHVYRDGQLEGVSQGGSYRTVRARRGRTAQLELRAAGYRTRRLVLDPATPAAVTIRLEPHDEWK